MKMADSSGAEPKVMMMIT